MVHDLSREQLRRLARLGARARLEELAAERRAILATFPGLAAQAARGTGGARSADAEAAGAAAMPARKRARRRKAMSAEQRKAVSERMRQFWADRRKAAGA